MLSQTRQHTQRHQQRDDPGGGADPVPVLLRGGHASSFANSYDSQNASDVFSSHSAWDSTSQSKHGPLIVRGSFAMSVLASKRQPAWGHSQRGGELLDGRKRGLRLPMLPLAYVFARVLRSQPVAHLLLRHARSLPGRPESLTYYHTSTLSIVVTVCLT